MLVIRYPCNLLILAVSGQFIIIQNHVELIKVSETNLVDTCAIHSIHRGFLTIGICINKQRNVIRNDDPIEERRNHPNDYKAKKLEGYYGCKAAFFDDTRTHNDVDSDS